jgi:chromosome segregation ATPase
MPMVRSESDGSIRQANAFLEDLQKLDAVSKDETRSNDLQRCSVDQEKTRQELETLQEKFTTASTDLESCKEKLSHVEPQLEQCRNSLGETQEELRKSADAHKQVQKRLDAMTADREELVDKLERAEIDALDRPTGVEHKTLQIQAADWKAELDRRPTHSENQTLKRSLESAEHWSKYWEDKCTEILAREPSPAVERPWEKEVLQKEIAIQKELVERLNVSLAKTKDQRSQLVDQVARMHDEAVQTIIKHQQSDDKRRQGAETLRNILRASQNLTQSTMEKLFKCRGEVAQSSERIQTLEDEVQALRAAKQTVKDELRDAKAQHATQLAALHKEREAKLRDADSATDRAETLWIAETERAAILQQELEAERRKVQTAADAAVATHRRIESLESVARDEKAKTLFDAETNRANDMEGELERTQQKVSGLEEQLADSRKDVENLNTLFRQLTESVSLTEELYKSCVWAIEGERDEAKVDYAGLQRQHNQQGHDYGCLEVVHADTVADLQAKMREVELAAAQHDADQKEIEMYKQARSEVLQFLYRSVMLRPDAFADDEASSVLEITERRLRDCKDAKDRIDSVHTAISDRLDVACVRLERYDLTMSERLETARSLISTRNRQISGLKKLVTTQESAHRTALQERNQLALALRDTSARYNELVQFVMSLE